MNDPKRRRSQKSKKQKPERGAAPMSQRTAPPPSPEGEPSADGAPKRRAPGEGLDKSDTGVIAGARLAGRRFTV